jgi:hypothetical protein
MRKSEVEAAFMPEEVPALMCMFPVPTIATAAFEPTSIAALEVVVARVPVIVGASEWVKREERMAILDFS